MPAIDFFEMGFDCALPQLRFCSATTVFMYLLLLCDWICFPLSVTRFQLREWQLFVVIKKSNQTEFLVDSLPVRVSSAVNGTGDRLWESDYFQGVATFAWSSGMEPIENRWLFNPTKTEMRGCGGSTTKTPRAVTARWLPLILRKRRVVVRLTTLRCAISVNSCLVSWWRQQWCFSVNKKIIL